jgi:hypothetical protein
MWGKCSIILTQDDYFKLNLLVLIYRVLIWGNFDMRDWILCVSFWVVFLRFKDNSSALLSYLSSVKEVIFTDFMALVIFFTLLFIAFWIYEEMSSENNNAFSANLLICYNFDLFFEIYSTNDFPYSLDAALPS